MPDNFRGVLLQDEPMSLHTSLNVGGPADFFAIPENTDDLQILLAWLVKAGIPWMIIGRGYNLLVRDSGIRGAVISLERFNQIKVVGDKQILADAGADNLSVVRFAQKLNLGGISYISGIPGTIGGAVRMNAGAYGQGILENTESLMLVRCGVVKNFHMSQLRYGYRYLQLDPSDIVLAALFNLQKSEPAITEAEIRKDTELRRTKHNVGFPSAGSFFKNPKGEAAWRVIDAAGMRGKKIGGAEVSPIHSNFLVNSGGATAEDFFNLADAVKKAVFATSGVTLEEEVRIVGDI